LAYGNFVEARKTAEQGLQLAHTLSDRQNEALSLLFLGGTFAFQGRTHEGIPILEQSLALYRTLEDKIGQTMAMYWLAKSHNDPKYSKTLLLESLQLNRVLGNLSGIADCLSQLALRETLSGDFSSPATRLEEARTIYHDLGNQSDEADILLSLGRLAYWQNDYQQARVYFEESLRLFEKVGVWWSIFACVYLAYTILRQGGIENARVLFTDIIQRMYKTNRIDIMVWAIEGVASLHLNRGQFERATRLFAWADAIHEKVDHHRSSVQQASIERDLAVIHAKLDQAEFAKFVEEGRAMTVEQAVAHALEPA